MYPTRALSLIAAACLLAGCTGMSEQACLTSDWRTVGFEDGAQGRPVTTIGSYRQACTKHGVSPDLASYRAGHAEGVAVYCRPSRGFEVGHRGVRYQGVCPADLEAEFLAAYDSGYHLYELESAVRRVQSQIASDHAEQDRIKKRLTAIGIAMASDETSATERVELVAEAAKLGARYGELDKELESLEHERATNQLALSDYQETLAAGA